MISRKQQPAKAFGNLMRPSREYRLVSWNAQLQSVPELVSGKDLSRQLLSKMHNALLIENVPCAFLSQVRRRTPLQAQPQESLRTAASACCLAGWPDVDAYYQGSGSCWMVPEVTIPLLCIQVGVSASGACVHCFSVQRLVPETPAVSASTWR